MGILSDIFRLNREISLLPAASHCSYISVAFDGNLSLYTN